jgi:hypothetical protein
MADEMKTIPKLTLDDARLIMDAADLRSLTT